MHAGQDARLANAQARAALETANNRLTADSAFYGAVCNGFSAAPCRP